MYALLLKLLAKLWKNPKLIGMIAVVGVIIGLAIALWLTHADLQDAQQKLAKASVERDAAVNALNKQNAAIDKLKATAAAQADALAAAERQAQQVKVVYRDRIKTIKQTVVPKDCKAAVDWARDQALQLSDVWSG
ncbi:MAG TPA: hypothetical protein VFM97_00550 [Gammaproteobacteria bacterium]|nr:hypothetical protein [Gammaproteobacteria bacterium]